MPATLQLTELNQTP